MCRKAKCAYLRKDGFCLLHREACALQHPDARCADGVARALPSRERHLWDCVEDWDLNTAKGRFAFRTRDARGYEVYRTCSRKNRYSSYYEASRKAIEIKRKRGVVLKVYECPFCGGYHLTHHKCGVSARQNEFAVPEMTGILVRQTA